ncbi:MAG: cupin domain-containing protein [Solirubrobacteraceae bacterium]
MREARIQETKQGRLPGGEGWFILNLGEMPWETVPGFGAWRDFDWAERPGGEPGVGFHVHVLRPGENFGYYHAEEAQEGFIVLSGEFLAVVEGQERSMRQWDYMHSPPGTAHVMIGAGDGPCVLVMFGSPDPRRKVEWIADETAARHGASVERTTERDTKAYGDPLPAVVTTPLPPPFGAQIGGG